MKGGGEVGEPSGHSVRLRPLNVNVIFFTFVVLLTFSSKLPRSIAEDLSECSLESNPRRNSTGSASIIVMLTAPPLVEASGFSSIVEAGMGTPRAAGDRGAWVDRDLGLPICAACSRLCAWDGIPLIPPPIGPALATSKLIGGIEALLQEEMLREEAETICAKMRFATSDFELLRARVNAGGAACC